MERCVWGQVDAWKRTKVEWTRTFGHFFFFSHRFQRSKHSAWWKKKEKRQKQNREQQRNGEHRFKAHASLRCSLHFVHFLHPFWMEPKLCPLFYFETFFILSSRAEKFSSIACRFSFIVCWTWRGKKMKYDRKEAKLEQTVPTYEMKRVGEMVTRSDFLCLF